MTKRYLASGLALVSAAAVSSCSLRQAETPEQCVERFETFLIDSQRIDGPDLRDARFQPIFTYDVTHMENVLEELVGKTAEERAGLRMTLSHRDDDAALDAFYSADVPPKGAIFAADDVTLYRIKGTPGSRDETIIAGCRDARPKAPLTHIQWIALPTQTDDPARPR